MAFIVDEETGNITLVQGDSGKYPVEQVPNDKHYTAYFGIYNSKRKPVGFEVNVDIPAYNAGQIVYDNDLYCWSHSGDCLYSLSESPVIDDVLYNDENEITEYTVEGINSICTEDGEYTRDPEKDAYAPGMYAWSNYVTESIFTFNGNPTVGEMTYLSDGETNKSIVSIKSILIDSTVYLRNVPNDIQKTEQPEVIPTTNIEFPIPASLTDFLKVPVNDDTAEYYFGIKLCDDEGGEDTLLLGDSQIGDLNTITVYPKKIEGTTNG